MSLLVIKLAKIITVGSLIVVFQIAYAPSQRKQTCREISIGKSVTALWYTFVSGAKRGVRWVTNLHQHTSSHISIHSPLCASVLQS